MKLYRRATSGKPQYIEITVKGDRVISKAGYVGGAEQVSERVCTPKNEGKANATTAHEQAEIEAAAKIKEKMEDGYQETLPTEEDCEQDLPVKGKEFPLFTSLPKNFAPCKPISKFPDKFDKREFYAQRKRDGHCLITIMNEKGQSKIYSRGIQDLSHIGIIIPCIAQAIGKMKKGSMCLHELTFERKSDKKEQPRIVAHVIRKKTAKDALEAYQEVKDQGDFYLHTFDIMFWEGEFIGNKTHKERYEIIKANKFVYDPIITYACWFEDMKAYKKLKWEGFILRSDKNSQIEYTMNGKPARAGSYKWKFLKTEDFLIVRAAKGTGGAHIGVYAQFTIAQYNEEEVLIEYGNVGPGTLSHDELKSLTKDIDSGKRKFPFGVEIEYQEREEDSGCLKFGQIQRIREFSDKPQKEYTS